MKANERFFILTPTPTENANVYKDARGKEMKWSGKNKVPSIGEHIKVTMNSIGEAVVKGYFESCGWLGIMMLPLNPPAWLAKQQAESKKTAKLQWQREGIGCVFGVEFEPLTKA